MTSTSGITQGLPPLPKSLGSLWSMGKESLSKAEASLGLKATSTSTTAAPGKIKHWNLWTRIFVFAVSLIQFKSAAIITF